MNKEMMTEEEGSKEGTRKILKELKGESVKISFHGGIKERAGRLRRA